MEKAAAEQAVAERAAAAALGLLQPLEALSLDADELRRVTAAALRVRVHAAWRERGGGPVGRGLDPGTSADYVAKGAV